MFKQWIQTNLIGLVVVVIFQLILWSNPNSDIVMHPWIIMLGVLLGSTASSLIIKALVILESMPILKNWLFINIISVAIILFFKFLFIINTDLMSPFDHWWILLLVNAGFIIGMLLFKFKGE